MPGTKINKNLWISNSSVDKNTYFIWKLIVFQCSFVVRDAAVTELQEREGAAERQLAESRGLVTRLEEDLLRRCILQAQITTPGRR